MIVTLPAPDTVHTSNNKMKSGGGVLFIAAAQLVVGLSLLGIYEGYKVCGYVSIDHAYTFWSAEHCDGTARSTMLQQTVGHCNSIAGSKLSFIEVQGQAMR